MSRPVWTKIIRDKAMQIAQAFELSNNRVPKPVHTSGVGYDLLSIGKDAERHIEVKGVSESWKTYTWQALHHTEVAALKDSPEQFYLYIVRFDIPLESRNSDYLETAPHDLYIIPGT